MKTIEVSTETFAMIWSNRLDGEECEDVILMRILEKNKKVKPSSNYNVRRKKSDIKWRDDVLTALKQLGGEADLADIYDCVRKIRQLGGRTLPASTEAVIRRELENNSSDSEAYTGNFDWFYSVNGIGSGTWGCR